MPAWLLALLPALIAHVAPVALTALSAVFTYLVHRYVKNAKVVAAFDWLSQHVGPVVKSVEQTYVDAITKNGSASLSPAQAQEALARALAAIMGQIPPEYLDILRQAFPGPGQLEGYVTTLIEGKVKDLTLAKATAAKSTFDVPGLR